jgi:DNA-binding response OmpR family regulator
MNELIARVKSLLGRNAKKTEKHIFKFGNFSFDSSNCTISNSNSKKKISQRESDVLLELCRNIEETVTSKSILVNLWGEDNYYNSCSLQVYITKLRNIFSTDSNVKIVNHRGVGYKLTINKS